MLVVETIARIRRAFFGQGKPIKAICRKLGRRLFCRAEACRPIPDVAWLTTIAF
jgi:hypothetical protein